MKRNIPCIFLCLVFLCLISVCVPPGPATGAGTDAECTLARKIGEEAAKVFAKNRVEGLKLFMKANGLCPEDPTINYNLGLAYYRNGNLKEAEIHLKKSIEKDGKKGHRLNVLAWVMLDIGADKAQALEYAEKSVGLSPDSPGAADTLVRALLENGRLSDAVCDAKKAMDRWRGEEGIGKRYREAIDAYMAFYLKKTKAGMHAEAIEGLKGITFDPDIANAYCWALYAAGRTDDALREAKKAQETFAGADAVADTFDRIMDGLIQASYKQFKEGNRADAIVAVDTMRKQYPSHEGLEEAYKTMFQVALSDIDTITVPEPKVAVSKASGGKGEGAGLLDEIQGSGTIRVSGDDLVVDVDTGLPECREKNPHGIAVIIGNRNYSRSGHGIPDVDFADRDAVYIKKYVTGVLGYREENIISELDVTKGEMERIFGTGANFKGKLYNFVRSESEMPDVFVYYAGHGASDQTGKDAFLVPVDADADYISTGGYPVSTFYDNLERVPARRVMVVMDACFCGAMIFRNVSPAVLKAANPVRQMTNGVVFASAGRDEMSNWYPEKRHSLFTYFFMKGLRGGADYDRDRTISVGELKRYLNENVPRRALRLSERSQTPIVLGDESWELAVLK